MMERQENPETVVGRGVCDGHTDATFQMMVTMLRRQVRTERITVSRQYPKREVTETGDYEDMFSPGAWRTLDGLTAGHRQSWAEREHPWSEAAKAAKMFRGEA